MSSSQVHHDAYVKRNEITPANLATIPDGVTVERFYMEQAPGSAILMADLMLNNTTTYSGVGGELQGLPYTYLGGRTFFPGRGCGTNKWAIGLYENYVTVTYNGGNWRISHSAGAYDRHHGIFGTSVMSNF